SDLVRGVGGGYRFAANARRVTLMDIILLFEDFAPGGVERSEAGVDTPVGQALAAVMLEIDEIAKATLSSITLATMLQWIERNRQARSAPRVPVRTAGRGEAARAERREGDAD